MKTQREALERVIESGSGSLTDADAGIIALARLLADQIDAAGDKAGTRLVDSYLRTLRTLRPAVGERQVETATRLTKLKARTAARGISVVE